MTARPDPWDEGSAAEQISVVYINLTPTTEWDTQMFMDNTLSDLVNDILDDTTVNTHKPVRWADLVDDTEVVSKADTDKPVTWVNLADLAESSTHNILTVRPRRRTYLHQSEAGYDWAAGKEFVITSRSSPYYDQVVAVDERHNLKRYGYTHVHIHYNYGDIAPLEIAL